jgi:hypothetical protein
LRWAMRNSLAPYMRTHYASTVIGQSLEENSVVLEGAQHRRLGDGVNREIALGRG